MAKKKSLKTLKEKTAKLFQLYVRLRDSDENGYGNCCSCGKNVHYKQGQGGHFVSRKYLSTLLDERNVHLECAGCNMYGGNPDGYALFMLNTYGKEEIERLNQLKYKTTKFTQSDYEVMIDDFKKRINTIKTERGLE